MCFMMQGNIPFKVQFEPTLDDAKIIFEEMVIIFQEVMKSMNHLGLSSST